MNSLSKDVASQGYLRAKRRHCGFKKLFKKPRLYREPRLKMSRWG